MTDLSAGDAAEGGALYLTSCAGCHGTIHEAVGRHDPLAPVLPEVTGSYSSAFPGVAPRLVVIEKIRHGQFFGVGGTMPLYSREALTDAEVAGLLAYLGLSPR